MAWNEAAALPAQASAGRALRWGAGGALAGLGILATAAWLLDPAGAGTAAARLDGGLIAAMCGLALLNYALRALRFALFSRRLGLGLPLTRAAALYVAGFALAAVPAKCGGAVRLWLLRRDEGIAYRRSMPLLLGDVVADAHAVLLIAVAATAALSGLGAGAFAITGALLAATALLAHPLPLLWGVRLLWRAVGRRARLFAATRLALRRTAALFDGRTLAASLALGLPGWLAECAVLWVCLRGMGADPGPAAAFAAFAGSALAGGAAMTPGGVGGAEAAMAGILIAAGVPAGTALAATAVTRLCTLWFGLALGAVTLPVLIARPRR